MSYNVKVDVNVDQDLCQTGLQCSMLCSNSTPSISSIQISSEHVYGEIKSATNHELCPETQLFLQYICSPETP